MKALLSRLETHALDVLVVDEFIHRDIDRPADYLSLADRLDSHQLFSREECEALLNERLQVAPRVAAHCRAVADVAVRIGQALNLAGFGLNLHLIHSAALVHDVARGCPNHAHRGAKLLRDMDMPLMADIVETHMEMTVEEDKPIREAEVVFLADKLVQEDHPVGLDERFHRRLNTCTGSHRARESARRRFEAARMLSGKIEAIIDRPLNMLLQEDLPTSS